jgi:hypothetical protein
MTDLEDRLDEDAQVVALMLRQSEWEIAAQMLEEPIHQSAAKLIAVLTARGHGGRSQPTEDLARYQLRRTLQLPRQHRRRTARCSGLAHPSLKPEARQLCPRRC